MRELLQHCSRMYAPFAEQESGTRQFDPSRLLSLREALRPDKGRSPNLLSLDSRSYGLLLRELNGSLLCFCA